MTAISIAALLRQTLRERKAQSAEAVLIKNWYTHALHQSKNISMK